MISPLQNLGLTNPDGTLKTAEDLQRDANQRINDARERAQRLGAEIAATAIEASSRDGAATVTVGAAGALQSLRLTDRVKGMSPVVIAASIMDAYGRATREVAVRTREIAANELGDERVTRMMADMLPDLAREDDDPVASSAKRS